MLNSVVLLKPASGLCNLNCKYCFYKDEVSKRHDERISMMTLETFSNIIQKMINNTENSLTISFQGGEPLLRGLSFFENCIDIVNKLNTKKLTINFTLQTNGILIDDKWAKFFSCNNFLIGISLDGDKDIHNLNRVDSQNNGTYKTIHNAIEILKQHNVSFNILTVVTKASSKHIYRIINFFKKEEFQYLQFIPCLDPLEKERGKETYSLDNKWMFNYLKQSFEIWKNDIYLNKRWYHRFFDNLLYMIDGQEPEACDMHGVCGINYVVEANGDVYPCDFYMLDEYKLGNFNDNSIDEIDKKRIQIHFIEDSKNLSSDCQNCKYLRLCRGGCRRNRDYYKDGLKNNYYCQAYKDFFDYALQDLINIYEHIINK